MDKQSLNNPHPMEEDSIDLKKYFFLILANWYWFIISTFVGLSVAWFVNRYTLPVYQVTSSLIISEDSRGRGLSGYENLIPGMEIFRTQKLVLNEISVLRSYSLSQRTLSELDFNISYIGVGRSGFKEAALYNSCPFIVIPDSLKSNLAYYPVKLTLLDNSNYVVEIDDQINITRKVKFGENFESEFFNFKIVLRDSANFTPNDGYSKYYFTINSISGLANNYKNLVNISTNDDKRGSVLFLSIAGNNQDQITNYVNKLMEIYIERGLEEKNQTAINTVNFIDQQLSIIDTSLKIAEMNLQDFRLKNRLINISSEGGIAYSRLEDYQKVKAMAELQNRYYKYLVEYVSNRTNMNQLVVPGTVDIADPLLSELIQKFNLLLSEKIELMFTVQEGSQKIAEAEAKIESVRKALLDNMESLIKNNNITQDETARQLSLAEKELEKLPVTERMLISIQRQYKVNDLIYTYLLQKRAESAIAKASNVSDNRILDYARPENAALISPKTKTNNMYGLVLGIFLPLGILFLLDLMNNKIASRMDVEKRTSVPIISTIGHSAGEGDIPVFEAPKSALSESFRGLRTNLQYLIHEKDQKVIAITSTISGEGKTFCSTNLAAIFAMAGKKTLLVGLDLRKPKVHKVFNLDNTIGVSTCLIGKTSFDEIIKDSKIENLFIAPSGPVPPNPAELIGSPEMADFLKEARQKFDIIILDTPPFGIVTDARLISRLADLSLIILRQNYSSLNILSLLEETYQKNEMGHMGLIINDIRNKGYYGYGYRYYNYGADYRYGYYYSYGSYQEEKS